MRFGEAGEAAHVGKHHRDLARFAAELELVGAPLDTCQQLRRHVIAEGAAQLAPVVLGERELRVDHGPIGEERADGGERRIEQPAPERKAGEGAADHRRDQHHRQRQPGDRSEPQHHAHQQRPGNDEHQDLEPLHPVGAGEVAARDDLVDHRRMDAHPGKGRAERRGVQIEQAAGRCPDQHDAAGDLVGERMIVVAEQRRRRDHLVRIGPLVVEHDVARGRRRHGERAELQCLERAVAARVAQRHQRRYPQRQPQCLDGEARIELRAVAPQQRHLAHHTRRIRAIEAEAAEPGRGVGQLPERPHGTGKRRQVRRRIAAGNGKAPLGRRRQRRRIGSEGKAEDRLAGGERRGKLRVIVAAHAIGLRKQHVEADRGGAELLEPPGERRELGARPRPLPVSGQRRLVDIDHPHRRVGGGAGQQALLEVEAEIADGGDRQRVGEPEQRQQRHEAKAQQSRQQPATDHTLL